MVTLTASVQAGSTAVKQGQVNFCDATAAHCSDIHLLGTSQLNSAGSAVLHLRPGVGAYSYKAEFIGTPRSVVPYAASASNVATLSVTGQISTATTITQSGPSGNYTLSASVYGFTKSNTVGMPTGTTSFLDTTTNNSVLATTTLAPSVSGPAWVNVSNPSVGNLPGFIVAGDFNGDGNLDLAVGINNTSNPVAILLGDGKGNFTPVTSSPITVSGNPILVQDFNGDGIPDLLLSNSSTGLLTVLLGNGDGTFTAKGSPVATNYGVFPVVAADFNGDGIPDLAAAGGYYLIILLGNGDGTFTQMPITSSIAGADMFNSMVVADFNGDGIPDLATVDVFESVSIFLGNGDGTFKAGSSITLSTVSSGSALTLASGDFNGDGKPDLAVPIYGSSSSVAILLGNGDGTFHAASGSPFAAGAWANRLAIGDFNGDGVTDLFAGAQTSGTNIFIFLGNGDGTFVPTPTGSTNLPCCSQTAFGDFNGDGVTDLASSDSYNGVANVLLTALKQASATTTGVFVNGPTPQQVVASYPGDSSYAPSESAPSPLQVQAAAPAFTPASGILAPSQSITLASTMSGAALYYQLSGALQTNGYVLYTSPILVSSLGTLTIQAYAVANNYGQSQISSATYTVELPNPVPVLSSMSPAFTTTGNPQLNITITGSGFTPISTAYWGTTPLGTQYVSATQLTAQLILFETARMGTAPITVQTPTPGGGVSNVLQFELDSGGAVTAPSFTTTTVTVKAGSPASYPVTLPLSATNVTVRCLNLPSGASCSYSANPGTLIIATLTSTPSGTYQITTVFNETLPVSSTALVFAPFLLLPLAGFRKKQKKMYVWALAFVIVALSAFAVSGCGGGSGGNGGGGGSGPTQQVTSSAVVTLTVH
jgi:hypothetical protein